jgi:hypothetical protein
MVKMKMRYKYMVNFLHWKSQARRSMDSTPSAIKLQDLIINTDQKAGSASLGVNPYRPAAHQYKLNFI